MVEWKASQGILTKDDDTSKLSLHVLLLQNLHNVMGIRSIRLMDGKIGWKRTSLNGTRGQIFREKRPRRHSRQVYNTFPSYLQHAALLDEELVAYLEQNRLEAIRAQELHLLTWAKDKTRVEPEVSAYLKVRLRLTL
jgi:hypothetical protein